MRSQVPSEFFQAVETGSLLFERMRGRRGAVLDSPPAIFVDASM